MVLEENPKWELLADVLSEIEEDLLDDVPDAGICKNLPRLGRALCSNLIQSALIHAPAREFFGHMGV